MYKVKESEDFYAANIQFLLMLMHRKNFSSTAAWV